MWNLSYAQTVPEYINDIKINWCCQNKCYRKINCGLTNIFHRRHDQVAETHELLSTVVKSLKLWELKGSFIIIIIFGWFACFCNSA